jgi:UDP-galactopyranose mutase
MKNIAIVGAGFSGSVVARELAEAGYEVEVFDSRPHVAGNCHTERDPESGVMIHRFSLPINLLTINQFFGEAFTPDEARSFIGQQADLSIENPQNFEEQALRFVGKDIYEAFFKGYTIKQWGCHPTQLPASILKRLPLRFNYDDNYYSHPYQGMPDSHPYQGMPENGYTAIVENILDHGNITVRLGSFFERGQSVDYAHVFYSGAIDAYFDYALGRLGYRTLDFEEIRADGDFQGCAVMNYGDEEVPFTRIAEHKYFTPWEEHSKTVCFREFSRICERGDIPYYPIRLVEEKALLNQYVQLAGKEQNVSFLGRLGTYRYLDMDVTVGEALTAADEFLKLKSRDDSIPAFFVTPV